MSPLWSAIGDRRRRPAAAVHGDFDVAGATFDSREVGPGDLFIALKGEATDGHRFVDQAFAAGAAAALVSEAVAQPHVLRRRHHAPRSNDLAWASRERCQGKVIGVTGSVGKTGTKEALFAALDRAAPGRAHRSVKSYNNHTGVPLSLARMPRATRFGMFEMGMNHAGELAALTRLVRPHVAIVTTIAPAHREYLRQRRGDRRRQGRDLPGAGAGRHRDHPLRQPAPRPADRRGAAACRREIVTFGLGEGADVRAAYVVRGPSGGSLVTAQLPGAQLSFTLRQPGEHWVSNALAVLAAVEAVGGDLAAAGLALADLGGLKGRGERHRVAGRGRRGAADRRKLQCQSRLDGGDAAGARRGEGRGPADRGARRDARARADSDDFHAALAEPLEAAAGRLCDPGRPRRWSALGESAWRQGEIGACARRGGRPCRSPARRSGRAMRCSSRDRTPSDLPPSSRRWRAGRD